MTAKNSKQIEEMIRTMKAQSERPAEEYNYEWKTADEIIANMNTLRRFSGYGTASVAEISDDPDTIRKAHELWIRLREMFNKEGKAYDPELFISRLGSIGDETRREVMRSAWWETLGGDALGDYNTLTALIELLHNGEQLETGTIIFGS